MTRNEYEAAEITEIGKAQDVILGEKEPVVFDNPITDPNRPLTSVVDTDE